MHCALMKMLKSVGAKLNRGNKATPSLHSPLTLVRYVYYFTINYLFMKKLIPVFLICVAFIGLAIGCSKSNSNGYGNTPPPPPPPTSGNNISIYNMTYTPNSKTVAKGTVVKWT